MREHGAKPLTAQEREALAEYLGCAMCGRRGKRIKCARCPPPTDAELRGGWPLSAGHASGGDGRAMRDWPRTQNADDLLRIDPCWLCRPEGRKRFWQAAAWVAVRSPWELVMGEDAVGRLRHVRLYEKRTEYLVGDSRERLHVQWLTGTFATARVTWLPPGCTGARKDQVQRATPDQIATARRSCPQCDGTGRTIITPDQALQRAPWDQTAADALAVWADRVMGAGDPRGHDVAMRLREMSVQSDQAP